MYRRQFLKRAAALSAASGSCPAVSVSTPSSLVSADLGAAPILKSFTVEDHRRRLENISASEKSVHECMRKHLVTEYIPGQVSYNLGEYPCRKPYNPDEYDERELDQLRDGGIRLIQIMEDWNDLLRLFGGDKFTAVNPAGLRRFIDMVHKRGMKILLYASTGYMQEGDPDLREDWVRGSSPQVVQAAHWRLVRCSPASPGWRAYVLPRTLRILDDYGPDGLFNDWGYIPLYNNPNPPTKEEVLAFHESADHDAALEDMVALIYSEVKRRGGVYKMHADGNNRPKFKEKLYDYLWVGEGVERIDKVREETKNHPPYVVPCYDFRGGKPKNEDEVYLNAIPYMQFPLLLAGRPFTGERAAIPGVHYQSEDKDPTLRDWRRMWKYYQEHPEGPFVYGPWDFFPIWPDTKARHARWLKQYLPLVQEGTWAYLDISESDLFPHALPPSVVASLFVNLETYLVLANYSMNDVALESVQGYVPADALSQPSQKNWNLKGRSFVILRRMG